MLSFSLFLAKGSQVPRVIREPPEICPKGKMARNVLLDILGQPLRVWTSSVMMSGRSGIELYARRDDVVIPSRLTFASSV